MGLHGGLSHTEPGLCPLLFAPPWFSIPTLCFGVAQECRGLCQSVQVADPAENELV